MKRFRFTALCAASAMTLAPLAFAQEETAGTEATQGTRDSQCMERLQTLAQGLQEDGYWLSGYRGYGTSTVPAPSAGRGVAPTRPQTVEPTGEFAVTPEAGETARDAPDGDPWRGVTWAQRPQYEIGVLYEAAYVLARSGDEEACMTVAEATQERYRNYVAELEELGIDPAEVTSWRQAEIAASRPVDEMEGRLRIDNIVGTNVRNAEDEDLGSVEDVMLDPRTGAVQYVVVSRGGLFGVGADEVVVPWERLRITPGLNAFVLPVDEAVLDDAPSLPDEGVFDTQQTGSISPDEIDSYWEGVEQ